MAFASLVSGSAQSHVLINQNVVANLGGLSDHDAHAVVDEKPAADRRAGMDLNAGEKARYLRNHSRQQRYIRVVEPVRETMQQDRVKSRIAKENLEDALGGRVFAKDGVDLFPDDCQTYARPPAGNQ